MKILHSIGLLGAAAVATLGTVAMTGSTGYASTPVPKNVAAAQQKVDARAVHIDLKMQTLRTRIATDKHLSTAMKTRLRAEIARVRVDVAAWRRQVDAARTMAGVHAADQAHRTLLKDVAAVKSDLTSKPVTKKVITKQH